MTTENTYEALRVELETASLEALGRTIDQTSDYRIMRVVGQVLADRMEGDTSKAKHLMAYHHEAFARHPCTKHWSELVAMMYTYQQLKYGKAISNNH